MIETTTPLDQLAPLAGEEAQRLAAAEHERFLALLRELGPTDWAKATDCPAWDVRALCGHVLGMTECFCGVGSLMRQMRIATFAARKNRTELIDELTGLQVREQAALSTDELVSRLATAGPRQARWRGRQRMLRLIPLTQAVGGVPERWRAGYLFDTILTRDTWMHRVDVSRATERAMVLTAEHDGRLVADVAAEWARRHGRPVTLHLTGPAGGTYTGQGGGEEITIDAVEFCRVLSGRAAGRGLLGQAVPF